MSAREWVRDLLRGCGRESDLMELASLLNDLSSAIARGDLSEDEAATYISQLCQSIASMASKCGKSLGASECEEQLKARVMDDALSNITERIAGIRSRLRRGRSESAPEKRRMPSIF